MREAAGLYPARCWCASVIGIRSAWQLPEMLHLSSDLTILLPTSTGNEWVKHVKERTSQQVFLHPSKWNVTAMMFAVETLPESCRVDFVAW